MIPLLSSAAMRDADAKAVARRSTASLVNDAGTAVALEARRMLDTCYGARVGVVVGPGLNGADGRVAAAWLSSRGALVDVLEVQNLPTQLHGYDLVIDAAFGLGCSRPFNAPRVASDVAVLAVDLPSGVDSDSGEVLGQPMRANVTLALGAVKPAHISGPAANYVGELRFAGLGIVTAFDDALMQDSDLATLLEFDVNDHKWKHAIQALVGSTLMPGAAELVLRGALAGGASMIRFSSRGDVGALVRVPPEVVHTNEVKVDARCRAVVAGPGLGSSSSTWLRERIAKLSMPLVLDADGLDRAMIDELSPRDASWVLTPHEGEFARLTGTPLGTNRLQAVRDLAKTTGCVVLLKGPITIVASPSEHVRVINAGTPTLATAGSGDVLAGLIAATIARGHDPFHAAALAAHLHARAGARLRPYATASDIATSIQGVLHELRHHDSTPTGSDDR
jgi:hydroxyethylthiazole kinase-like uncharacterized protein yjeF